MPDWLVAKSNDAYVKAAVRLINDDVLRLLLRRDLIERHAVNAFYDGKPELFAQRLETLIA